MQILFAGFVLGLSIVMFIIQFAPDKVGKFIYREVHEMLY